MEQDRIYIASQGESFEQVADMAYGDSYKSYVLLRANSHLADKLRFEGGEKILVPVLGIEENSLPIWKR